MNQKFEKLLEKGQIGRVTTRNRMIKTANGTSFIQTDGYVGDRALAFYETMAKGGVGLIITESCGVEYPLGVQHPPVQFHLDDDKYIPSYAELVKVIHNQGCPAFIQFQHAGPWNPTGLADVVQAIANDTNEIIPCSVTLDGEYGCRDLSISVPAVLGRGGVKRILEWQIAPDELELLDVSINILKPTMKYVEELLYLCKS